MPVEQKVLMGGIVFTKHGDDRMSGITRRVTEYGKRYKTGESYPYEVHITRSFVTPEAKEGEEAPQPVEAWSFAIERSYSARFLRMEGPRTYPSAEICVDAAISYVDGWHEANQGS